MTNNDVDANNNVTTITGPPKRYGSHYKGGRLTTFKQATPMDVSCQWLPEAGFPNCSRVSDRRNLSVLNTLCMT